MGEVGGNGSVVWLQKHQGGAGQQFRFRNAAGKLGQQELRRVGDAGAGGVGDRQLQGYDNVPIADIGDPARPAPGVAEIPELAGFQRKRYFLVRLRFDGPEATAIQNWFATSPGAVPQSVRIFTEENSLVMAIRVKAVERPDFPDDSVSFADMPWEIRYDW